MGSSTMRLSALVMHRFHYGFLGRDIWAVYCECGWSDLCASEPTLQIRNQLFTMFIEHLVQDEVDDES